MKNLVNLGLLLIFTLTLSSCQKIKSLFDVEVETTLNGNLYIDVMESAMKTTLSTHFHEEVVVDPLDDDDIAEYDKNITEIKATNVIATVVDVSKEGVVFEKGTFITVKGSQEVTWQIDEPWAIEEDDQLILGDNVSVKIYDKITTMLSNRETLTIIADGYCNQTGVSVTLKVGIDVTVTANPL
jgi:hypothetical protein